MSSTTSQSYSAFHQFFHKEKTSAETETNIDFISSIWYDDHIWRLDEKKWKCLWCDQSFQIINATKALACVLGNKGVPIKSCYVDKDKSHTTRYQELRHYKQTRKGVLLYYSEKIKASITSLQNKSSTSIESTIRISSISINSSNDIIIKKNTLPSLFVMPKFLVSCCVRFIFSNITTFNMHTLLPQYMSKSLSSIDYLKTLITP